MTRFKDPRGNLLFSSHFDPEKLVKAKKKLIRFYSQNWLKVDRILVKITRI